MKIENLLKEIDKVKEEVEKVSTLKSTKEAIEAIKKEVLQLKETVSLLKVDIASIECSILATVRNSMIDYEEKFEEKLHLIEKQVLEIITTEVYPKLEESADHILHRLAFNMKEYEERFEERLDFVGDDFLRRISTQWNVDLEKPDWLYLVESGNLAPNVIEINQKLKNIEDLLLKIV